MYRKCNWQYQK